jgi:hypothetical protein
MCFHIRIPLVSPYLFPISGRTSPFFGHVGVFPGTPRFEQSCDLVVPDTADQREPKSIFGAPVPSLHLASSRI